MNGTIDVALVMNHEQSIRKILTKTDEDFQRIIERQHFESLNMAWNELGAAKDADARADVQSRWGETLEEAIKRMKVHRRWINEVHRPRVEAWQSRMLKRQSLTMVGG